MAKRGPDERVNQAFELFKEGKKLVEIASQLNIPEGTVRSWKNRYKWDSDNNATLHKNNRNVAKKKKGGQPGNKNATGPPGNRHAEKHGFLTKYLPPETADIINNTLAMDPIDILWQNISIQYAAIIRAQQLMYVKDQNDLTKVLKRQKESSGMNSDSWEKEYELQFAWDKHASFLQAQARAMTSLNGMIKQYEELMKSGLATEEQKARIEKLRAEVKKITENDNPDLIENDGFIDALSGKVDEVWQE